MRKLFVISLLVLAIVGVAGLNVARAGCGDCGREVWIGGDPGCGNCADKCHSCDTCKHKDHGCKPKCDGCGEMKCHSCKPKCHECKPKCKPCCPQVPCEYPDPCHGSTDPMTRDGLSRQKAK